MSSHFFCKNIHESLKLLWLIRDSKSNNIYQRETKFKFHNKNNHISDQTVSTDLLVTQSFNLFVLHASLTQRLLRVISYFRKNLLHSEIMLLVNK